MSAEQSALAREELRALLVLGIIGTLLSVRDILNIDLGYGIRLNIVVVYLILYWGAYVFLAVIAISDDWVNLRIANACGTAAALAFLLGVCATSGMALFATLAWILVHFISPSMTLAIAGITAFVFFLIAIAKIMPRNHESA